MAAWSWMRKSLLSQTSPRFIISPICLIVIYPPFRSKKWRYLLMNDNPAVVDYSI
jgi:hypothetical protein